LLLVVRPASRPGLRGEMMGAAVVVLLLVGFFWGVIRLGELSWLRAVTDDPQAPTVYRCACGAKTFNDNQQCDGCRYRAAAAPQSCRWCSGILPGDELWWHEQQCREHQRREQRERDRLLDQGEGFPETREYLWRGPGVAIVHSSKPPKG